MSSISFIIPARNEATLIPETVANIRQFAPAGLGWELLVADNGSTDQTFEVARSFPDVRVLRSAGTVGDARNSAAAEARGCVLVFLDADVRLTPGWHTEICRVVKQMQASPRLVTGSTVSIPASPSAIERHWFQPATLRPRHYINSGHLIIARSFFEELHGFDATLRTGEDFDLCSRARAAGGLIRDDRALEAVHLGFPKTVSSFVRRELWHGQGDGGSLGRILRSRVALVSVLVTALTIAGPVVSLATKSAVPIAVCFGAGLLIALVFAIRRTARLDARSWMINTALYYLYFLARTAALVLRQEGWRQRKTDNIPVNTV